MKFKNVVLDDEVFKVSNEVITLHTKDAKGKKVILTCRQAISNGTNVLVYEVLDVTGEVALYTNKDIAVQKTIAAETEIKELFQDT